VEIEALALHAKVKTELPIPTELFCRQSSRLDLLEEEDVLGKQPQVLDTTKTELTVPRQAIRRRLITGQSKCEYTKNIFNLFPKLTFLTESRQSRF
jgi:hypothetical protein